MSEEENKAIARRYFEEVWNRRNLDAVDELSAEDIVSYGSTRDLIGPDDIKKFVSEFQNDPQFHYLYTSSKTISTSTTSRK